MSAEKDKWHKRIFGYPNEAALKEAWKIAVKYRFMIWIYLLLTVLYICFFLLNEKNTLLYFDEKFGKGFGTSFSASMLEGLIMFLALTIGITFISIKQSTINPEDHEFERRVLALMNSKHLNGDSNIFDFLKNNISNLLAYNKKLAYEVHVSAYYPAENAYYIIIRRTHILTNMCKDKDYEPKNKSISIFPDIKINNSYGKVMFLGKVDPNNENNILETIVDDTDNYELKAGKNQIQIDMPVSQNSEIGYRLSYGAYSKIEDVNDDRSWIFSEATRYTRQIEFLIQNHLGDNKKIQFDFRKSNLNNEKVSYIEKSTLSHLEKYKKSLMLDFLPGEKIEVYIYPPFEEK